MDSSGRSSSSRTLHLDRSDDDPIIERQLRALGLATTILIIGKLLTHRDRWSPKSAPIR
jgi:hypothetical protein